MLPTDCVVEKVNFELSATVVGGSLRRRLARAQNLLLSPPQQRQLTTTEEGCEREVERLAAAGDGLDDRGGEESERQQPAE